MVGAHRGRAPMTVRAADLAFADLPVDRGETACVPSELCYECVLGSDVVELQDDGIPLSAVDARVLAKDLEDMSEVPRDVRTSVRARRDGRRCRAPPPTPDGGPAAMAVCAHDLAPGDLGIDGFRRRRVGDQVGDVRRLLPDMIELQDDRVALAAVGARPSAKVSENVLAHRLRARDLCGVRLATMQISARSEVGGEAGPAPPLQAVAVPIEALDRQVLPAAAAAPQLPGLPHTQAFRGDGVWRSRRKARRPRRLESAHPHADRRLRDPQLAGDTGQGPAELAA